MSNQGEDIHPADPFVDLLLWLVARNGGVHFANDGGVDVISATTVRRWLRGDYPKTRVEDSVGQVDLWARSKFPGEYPPESARGGLRFYCGPQRPTPGAAPHPIDASPQQTDDRTDPDTAEQAGEVAPHSRPRPQRRVPTPTAHHDRPNAVGRGAGQ